MLFHDYRPDLGVYEAVRKRLAFPRKVTQSEWPLAKTTKTF